MNNLLKYFDYIYFFDNWNIIWEWTLDTLLLNQKFKNIWDKNK